jgi:pimeloyl-ACP methyl ester carboxylesterase
MNKFPAGFNGGLTGFGGDASKNRDEHRKDIKKTPIILAHGNGANATSQQWGWQTMVGFLKEIGYRDSEIWAMDYLGEDNDQPIIPGAHRDHIDRFRKFVDSVREYLNVEKLDFIAHSLGCGMVNAYIKGLQSNGTWKQSDNRMDFVGTFVALAGGTYGLGQFAQDEFKTGSDFERQSHVSKGTADDTPAGSTTPTEQISPVESWKKTTALDNDESSYAAIIAVNDFVDMQYRDTSRREGADLNARYDLGYFLDGHEKVIKSKTVFNDFKIFLNKHAPQPPVTIQVDKVSGNYSSPLPVTVTVNPTDQRVDYVARRLRKEFQAGYIIESAEETLSGTLSNHESLTLANTGVWEVKFSAPGAADIVVSYGVGVDLPVVTIEPDNTTPFKGSLDVMARTTRGRLYYSPDGQGWIEGAIFHITRTCTVHFIAIDSEGIASMVVEKAYKRNPDWDDRVTATLCEHFIAKRLDLPHFLDLGNKLGGSLGIAGV